MAVEKSIQFAAPYTSATFNAADALLVGRNGVITGGDVTTSGGVATIQPLTFVQNGLMVTSDASLSVALPINLVAPYYIVVTTSSSVENPSEVITPTFANRPQDVSVNSVLVAYFDGEEWINTTRLQLNEIINSIAQRTIEDDTVGIADGFEVTVSGPNLVVSPGSLFDQQGALFTKNDSATFAVISPDVDAWTRIDQIIYRRPDDSVVRGGVLQEVVGNSYNGTNPYTQIHQLPVSSSPAVKYPAKVLLDGSTNTKYLFWMEDTGARANLNFAMITDSATPVLSGSQLLVTGGVTGFDVVYENASFGLVYTIGNSLFYQKLSLAGAPLGSAVTIQTSTAALINPKVVTIRSSATYYLHIVFQELTSNVVYRLFYARMSATATVQTTPAVLVDLTNLVQNPSIDKDDNDSVLYLVFENAGTGRIYLREYLADTATSSAAPTQLGSTLELGDDVYSFPSSSVLAVGQATMPIVKRANNKDLFVFWRQLDTLGNYGIGIYGNRYISDFGHKAILQTLVTPNENYLWFDVAVDGMNTAHLALVNSSSALKATIRLSDLLVGVNATISAGSPSKVGIAFDALGSLVPSWAFASSGFVNNGSAIAPTQRWGSGLVGAQVIQASEFVVLASQFSALPTTPTNGDLVVVTGTASNNGTLTISGYRAFTDSSTNYIAIQVTATLTPEAGSGSAQFQIPAATVSNVAKATAGVFSNMRGFYVTPTDVQLAYYATDGRLAVVGPAIEETPTISRIYELFNSVMGGSGQISWNVLASQVLSFGTALQIRLFNRVSTYSINALPGGITIADGQIAYIELPDTDEDASLNLQLVEFGDGILDRFGRQAIPIFWNIGGDLYIRFAPYRLSTDEHTVYVGESISQQLVDFIGAVTSTPNPDAHNYLSTNYILQTDSHEAAIGKLDSEMAALAAQISEFLTASSPEETHTIGVGGTNTFTCTGFTWNADVTTLDIMVYVNGIHVIQDPTGGSADDFAKTSDNNLLFTYTVPEGARITVRRTSVTLAPAQEEEHTVGVGGTSTYNAVSMTWNPSNALPDVQVFVNGIKQIQDQTGGLNQDFRKVSTTELQFSYTVPQGAVILVRLERNGTGSSINISNQGNPIMSNVAAINFVGAGVTATAITPTTLQVSIGGAGSGAVNIQKSVYNNTGVTIPANSVLAWADDGSVELAEADVFSLTDFAGIAMNDIPNGTYGQSVKDGNVAAVLTGLGAAPGQDVYLSVTPGGLTLTAPNPLVDTVYKIGRAEPPTGFASPTAVDLYIELDEISSA